MFSNISYINVDYLADMLVASGLDFIYNKDVPCGKVIRVSIVCGRFVLLRQNRGEFFKHPGHELSSNLARTYEVKFVLSSCLARSQDV